MRFSDFSSFLLTFFQFWHSMALEKKNDSFIYWDSCPDVPSIDKSHESYRIRGSFFIARTQSVWNKQKPAKTILPWGIDEMTFYEELDAVMKQDFGGRGLLASLPPVPLKEAADTLAQAKRAILLTGFPVRLSNGTFTGETDGPSGTANLAAALVQTGCTVFVVTDHVSAPLLKEALRYRAPMAALVILPTSGTDLFIRNLIREVRPTHFISLERPGKARDGHYHNMRGEIIDDMLTDSSLFLSEAKKSGAVTISIGDGGNEMGMGTYRRQVEAGVPCGDLICTEDGADITLASGVSNWWGWGIASLLSLEAGRLLLPDSNTEQEMLHRVVMAGGVDGCTKEPTETVDHLELSVHLFILKQVSRLTVAQMEKNGQIPMYCGVLSTSSEESFRL